jgi:hypothetical protein
MAPKEKLSDLATTAAAALGDERRELLRIDDRLLIEYWKVGEPPPVIPLSPCGLSEETLAAMINKPTTEVLSQGSEMPSVLVPWMMKIDWVLELVLRTLDRLSPQGIATPALTDVNVSGGGIRFNTSRRLAVLDQLEIEIILPPFAPVRTRAEVVRVMNDDSRFPADFYNIAVRFTTMTAEDKERLIRYVLQKQAARLRERHLDETPGTT